MTLDMGIYELRAEVFIAKKEIIECTCVQCQLGLEKKELYFLFEHKFVSVKKN